MSRHVHKRAKWRVWKKWWQLGLIRFPDECSGALSWSCFLFWHRDLLGYRGSNIISSWKGQDQNYFIKLIFLGGEEKKEFVMSSANFIETQVCSIWGIVNTKALQSFLFNLVLKLEFIRLQLKHDPKGYQWHSCLWHPEVSFWRTSTPWMLCEIIKLFRERGRI